MALRNRYAEPWAYGVEPFLREVRQVTVTLPDGTQRTDGELASSPTDLADNHNLTGRVTWAGYLLGFSDATPVAGDASIGVDLGTLSGRADFTKLEAWAMGQPPGDAGTGTMWGDGDLGYLIAVQGNTFKQTGGDEGILIGIFTGESHKGGEGFGARTEGCSFGGAQSRAIAADRLLRASAFSWLLGTADGSGGVDPVGPGGLLGLRGPSGGHEL